MFQLVTVAGTWGSRNERDWWKWNSKFWKHARSIGAQQLNSTDKYNWDTDLDGIIGRNKSWSAGGSTLKYYVQAFRDPKLPLVIVAHSHGGQVLAEAAQQGLKCEIAITLGVPVRHKMFNQYQALHQNAETWIHCYSKSDWWQIFGSLRDGYFGIRRWMPYTSYNVRTKGHSHNALHTVRVWDGYEWWKFMLGMKPGDF